MSSSVIALYTRLLEAWNLRDADAFASLFTTDGSIVGFDGSQMNGASEIGTERAIFASHPTAAYVAKVREVRQLDCHTILIRAIAGKVLRGWRS